MSSFAEIGERILADRAIPVRDRLAAVLEALTRFALEHGAIHRALYGVAGAEAVKTAANERLIALIASAAREGVDTGAVVCEQPDVIARALYHGYCGAATDAVSGSVDIDTESLVRCAAAMTRSVFPAPAG
ncbi:hypothetical protein [Nocardia sp. NPDC057455]|uniref:hypothetical protein n=1 Tax=Nocardia sp. NPDC057455 TaxID=3346138 RepID=UPI00366E62E2